MKFQSFEDMEIWQDARKLTHQIRRVCKSEPARRDFAWVDQITRAGISIMANIAEGNDARTNTEFVNFLGYAKRSVMEACSHLYYGVDESYMSEKIFNEMRALCRKIARQAGALMAYLCKHPTQGTRNS